jgi:hypothetical protein
LSDVAVAIIAFCQRDARSLNVRSGYLHLTFPRFLVGER